MLLNNPLIIENELGEEIDAINAEGHPCSFPKSFYASFIKDNAFISKDDIVGFKTTVKNAIANMENILTKTNIDVTDDNYQGTIRENIEYVLNSIKAEKYPDNYIVSLYYGCFGDVMTLDNVKELIPF